MRKFATVLALVTLTMPALAEHEQEVRCREIGFSKSVEMQDHELFASFIDPDARFITLQASAIASRPRSTLPLMNRAFGSMNEANSS